MQLTGFKLFKLYIKLFKCSKKSNQNSACRIYMISTHFFLRDFFSVLKQFVLELMIFHEQNVTNVAFEWLISITKVLSIQISEEV